MRNVVPLAVALMAVHMLAVAAAEALPPPVLSDELPGKGTLKQDPVGGLQLGSLEVVFERTALSAVLASAKAGSIGYRGETGNAISYVCFTDAESEPASRIWLISNVMGLPARTVIEVDVKVLKDAKPSSRCPSLPAHLRPAALKSGVWVGMPEPDLLNKMGKPSLTKSGWVIFNHFTKYRDADRSNVLHARIKDGRIVELRAIKVTTY